MTAKRKAPEAPKAAKETTALVPTPEAAAAAIYRRKDEINALVAKAEAQKITDSTSQTMAVELLGEIKRRKIDAEETRKAMKRPWDTLVRAIDGAWRAILDPLDAAERTLKNRWAIYVAEERAAQEKALEKQRAHEQAFQKANPSATVLPVEAPAPVSNITTTASGSKAVGREVPDFEILDLEKVPHQYLDLNPTRVKAAMRSGVREIPGLRLFWRQDVSVGAGR
jgi:hypothetical protein